MSFVLACWHNICQTTVVPGTQEPSAPGEELVRLKTIAELRLKLEREFEDALLAASERQSIRVIERTLRHVHGQKFSRETLGRCSQRSRYSSMSNPSAVVDG